MERRASASHPSPVLGGIAPPGASHGVVARPRLTSRLDDARRVGLVVAPPGFGKTTLVREQLARLGTPGAWVSLDALDETSEAFWHAFERAVHAALPDFDGQPEAVTADGDDASLRRLTAQVEHAAPGGAVVLDGVSPKLDHATFGRLAAFVERVGHRLPLLITARADPPLPLAHWRASGWVTDVDETHLRFTDEEAAAVAARFDALELSPRTVAALNEHVGGWPIAFHLALVAASNAQDAEARAAALMAVDALLRDYVVAEVLDQLPAAHRDAALALSVLDAFDSDLCHAICGPTASELVADLGARHLLTSSIADPPGVVQLQPMFRRLLAAELRWGDPQRHAQLHRQAAAYWRERGDRNAAYLHLRRAGGDAVDELVMTPAIELAERDDRHGLAALVEAGPRVEEVEHPGLALDLAVAALFAGRTTEALRYCDRAEAIAVDPGDELGLRLHATRGLVALRRGDLDAAARFVDAFEQTDPLVHRRGPVERHFALAGARVALAQRDLGAARRWLDRIRWITTPPVLAQVTIPALEARFELLCGRVRTAIDQIEQACARSTELGIRPHAATVEAEITAAASRMAAGDLALAASHARGAMSESARLGSGRDRVRAALAAARVRVLADDGATSSVLSVRDLLRGVDPSELEGLSARVDVLLARALLRGDRAQQAGALVARLGDHPQVRLVRAEVALTARRNAEVAALLEPASNWLTSERLEAQILLAVASRPAARAARLAAVIEEAAVSGWVAPFLGHSPAVEAAIGRQPLERMHPTLALHFGAVRSGTPLPRPVAAHGDGERLTARELTILELLPSHLSYAQIAAQLYLSHNTVKSNLKSVYRKLGVSSRSGAVDAARAAGLLASDGRSTDQSFGG